MTDVKKILMVAGEASADFHGSELIEALRNSSLSFSLHGVGGRGLKEKGMEVLIPATSLNVIGGVDWSEKMLGVWQAYRALSRWIKIEKPDLAILMDLPDFNLSLAKVLKKQGVPVIYYISPQVWAWRKYRVRKIRRLVDLMLVVFPFEKKFYEAHHVPSVFVGHPLIELLEPRSSDRTRTDRLESPQIALLPGSRPSELKFHGPILAEAAIILRARYPKVQFQVPIAPTLETAEVASYFAGLPVTLIESSAKQVLHWADVALVTSGTATLEATIVGTPFCLFYKVRSSSAFLLRHLFRYRGLIGMPNILLGREAVREFFQQRARPEFLAEEACRLLNDEGYRVQMIEDFAQCRSVLGGHGASQRAAVEVQKLMAKLGPIESEGVCGVVAPVN